VSEGGTRRLQQLSFEIIAFKVLEYLNDNPEAQDTLEGITSWWLPQVDIQYQRSKINDVLKELTNKGVLIEHQQSGAPIYAINHNRRGEISTLLKLLKRAND
jgi:hypothetical protein